MNFLPAGSIHGSISSLERIGKNGRCTHFGCDKPRAEVDTVDLVRKLRSQSQTNERKERGGKSKASHSKD